MPALAVAVLLVGLAGALGYWAWQPGTPPTILQEEALDVLPIMADPVSFSDTLAVLSKRALVGLGVPPEVVQVERTPEELGSSVRWELVSDVPGVLPLAVCNLELTRMARRLGGEVIGATEDRSGNRLSMQIGMKGVGTNLVTLRRDPNLKRSSGRLAVIVDDFGYQDPSLIDGFCRLKQTLTFSIFPDEEQTSRTAIRAHESGHGVMIHLPMEPIDYPARDPGKDAIFSDYSDEEIRRITRTALSAVPFARGVNNHMGSRSTQDARVMRAALSEIRERGFFFVDSRTTSHSIAFDVAQAGGVPSGRNDRFLDLREEPEPIERALRALARQARIQGTAIGICHAKQVTLKVLERVLPELADEGFVFVRVEDAVR